MTTHHIKPFHYMRNILLVVGLTLFHEASGAETAAMTQTKTKLQQLESKINGLQHTLNHAHTQRSTLTKELADAEKKIGQGIQKLRLIEQENRLKQRKIADLQRQVDALTEQLHTQQQLLAKHVRARYVMGEYQPLKWLLNQDDPSFTSRLLTAHQYIVHSRQQMITEVSETQQNLSLNQKKLNQELTEQQQLQQQLKHHQDTLEQAKHHHTTVIHALNQDIQSKEQSLKEYRRNKDQLSQLLKTLTQQSVIRPQTPFTYMRKKLPRPVNGSGLKNINQGVVFFAPEGTPVTAVSSGKVVFSNWLNGYGLLLIIDHGQGFMTLYAHNQSLFKTRGAQVRQGEQIATVGHTGGIKQNGLYFEIRQRGKAIPPLKWLS